MTDDLTIDGATWTFLMDYMAATEVVLDNWGAATSCGLTRKINEDSWGNRDESLFVVADGMGGLPRGDLAAETTVDILTKSDPKRPIDWDQMATSATMSLRASALREGLRGCGSAFVAAEVTNGVVTIANLGDSRCYLLRDGALEQVSEDHTLEAELIADGLDELISTITSKQKRSLTRYVGVAGDKAIPSVTSLTVANGDQILLCSDGVYRQLSESEIVSTLSNTKPAGAAGQLVQLADNKGGIDNSTALCLSFARK